MKTLWIVSGGIEAVAGIRRARELGLHVVVSDRDPGAPGFRWADDGVLASTYDAQETVEAAGEYHRNVRPVDGVLSIAADVPVTTASVAAALSLPGISLECARLAVDKLAMKERFACDGIPVPWFRSVADGSELRALFRERGERLVVKPVDSRGARGVVKLDASVDPDWAYDCAKHHSPSGRVMVERFLEGPQISTESLILDGSAHTPCLADRNYEYLERFAPHIIENGGDLPSCLPLETQRAVSELAERAARSLGIASGVAKGDIVVCEGEPTVIEMAPRLSGGYLCSHEIPVASGVDFVGAAIRLALGERVDPGQLRPTRQRHVCQRWLFPAPGCVVAVNGVEEASAEPGVFHCELRVGPGDRVGCVDNHPARAGLVMSVGGSREQAQERAAQALRRVRIETVS